VAILTRKLISSAASLLSIINMPVIELIFSYLHRMLPVLLAIIVDQLSTGFGG
jgi:hypothetical protein